MSSDNVALLVYTQNISAGSTISTPKVLLGQYISLSIFGYSDQDLTLTLQFSGDGTNWDYSVSNNLLTASNTLITSPVVGKWTRLRITNLGILDTTALRIYVYGTPSNSSITAQISKIGNFDPSVRISNFPVSNYGDLRVAEMVPLRNYLFSKTLNGAIATSAYKTPYSDIVGSTADATARLNNTGGMFGIYGLASLGVPVLVTGAPVRYAPGQGITARFSGIFYQGLKNVGGLAPTTEYLGIGNGVLSTRTVNDFLGFGWINSGLASSTNYFGIVYVRAGVRTFIPHTSWNIDKADGTYHLPTIDFTKIVVYQINVQYLGGGNITFYIESPSTGVMLPVHQLTFQNSSVTNLSEPFLGFLQYMNFEAGSIPVTLDDFIGCGSMLISTDGEDCIPLDRFSVNRSFNVLAGVETLIYSIKNETSFYGSTNYRPLILDSISASSDGTKPVVINLYRNCTIGGAPVYNIPYQYLSPHSVDTAGTFGGLGTGVLLYSFTIGYDNSDTVTLKKMRIELTPGSVWTLTCSSAGIVDIIVTTDLHVN